MREAEIDRALRMIPEGATGVVAGLRVTKRRAADAGGSRSFRYAVQGAEGETTIRWAVRDIMNRVKIREGGG